VTHNGGQGHVSLEFEVEVFEFVGRNVLGTADRGEDGLKIPQRVFGGLVGDGGEAVDGEVEGG
jgi:hypothetical protein